MDGQTGTHEEDDGTIRRNFVQGTQVHCFIWNQCNFAEKECFFMSVNHLSVVMCQFQFIVVENHSVLSYRDWFIFLGKHVLCCCGNVYCGPWRHLSPHFRWSYAHCCLDNYQVQSVTCYLNWCTDSTGTIPTMWIWLWYFFLVSEQVIELVCSCHVIQQLLSNRLYTCSCNRVYLKSFISFVYLHLCCLQVLCTLLWCTLSDAALLSLPCSLASYPTILGLWDLLHQLQRPNWSCLRSALFVHFSIGSLFIQFSTTLYSLLNLVSKSTREILNKGWHVCVLGRIADEYASRSCTVHRWNCTRICRECIAEGVLIFKRWCVFLILGIQKVVQHS